VDPAVPADPAVLVGRPLTVEIRLLPEARRLTARLLRLADRQVALRVADLAGETAAALPLCRSRPIK
jgi:hypothetical protein